MGFNIFALTNPTAKKVSNYAVTIPSTVKNSDLNCNNTGDKYAEAIYRSGTGHYAQLKGAFERISSLCNSAKGKKGLKSTAMTNAFKDAIKDANQAAQKCGERRTDFQSAYDITKDIYNSMEREETDED